VIDGFLELEVYWASLKESVDRTKGDEQASWDALWVELQRRVDRYRVQDACEASVIHGDCKVNNLLFADNSNAVVAILDLDTLMVGRLGRFSALSGVWP
jgi:Ser/Thr protein kinase RdoA (MazF antagonist)